MFPELKEINEKKLQALVNNDNFTFQRKYDGTAGMLCVNDSEIQLLGRGILSDNTRQDYTKKFPELVSTFEDMIAEYNIKNVNILGEITWFDKDGIDQIKGIQSRANRKENIEEYMHKYPATFVMFDAYKNRTDCNGSYAIRKQFLRTLIQDDTDTYFVIDDAQSVEAKQQYVEDMNVRENGWEGITVKDNFADWCVNQFKFKPKLSEDVFWEGEYKPGQNRHVGRVGSLICYQYIDGVKMHVANVGGGLTDELREEMTQMVKDRKVSHSKPWVMEVQTHQLLSSGKLRYPNFMRWRYDKAAAQCQRNLR